jgi:hypothetical protein
VNGVCEISFKETPYHIYNLKDQRSFSHIRSFCLDSLESVCTLSSKDRYKQLHHLEFLVKRNPTTQPCMPSCCESDSLSRACVQVLFPDFAIGRKRRSHCRRRQGLQCRCLYLCFGQPKPRELMSSRHLPILLNPYINETPVDRGPSEGVVIYG